MTANVEVVGQEKRDVLTVPVEAITRKTGKFFATVAKGQDAKEERGVEVGISDGVKSEIISGLEEGETVTLRKTVSDSRWSGGQRRPEGGMMLPFGGGRGRR
jgi:multidrug efflux pump subunit AcrA (membrane-fusion protein)